MDGSIVFYSAAAANGGDPSLSAFIQPLLPGDSLDAVLIHVVSTSVVVWGAHVSRVEVYANDSKPVDVAAARNGLKLFDVSTVPWDLPTVNTESEYTAVFKHRLPMVHRPTQRHRHVTVIVTAPPAIGLTGFVMLDVFRRPE